MEGKVLQVLGPIIDAVFESGQIPKIHENLFVYLNKDKAIAVEVF